MAKFALPQELSAVHDDVLAYASALQNTIAAYGGCQSMASEALNALAHSAAVTHQGVRTLCEEGWTPLTPILNRTLLDIFGSCVAVVNRPAEADYMGFKYVSDFYRKWLTETDLTDQERLDGNAALDRFVGALHAGDQQKARDLIREGRPRVYWFQPEYPSTRDLLQVSPHNIYRIFKLFSPVTHGGFASRLLFNDAPGVEDIEPHPHPRNTPMAIVASSRLLLEVCYIRDQWDNFGVGLDAYNELVARLNAFR